MTKSHFRFLAAALGICALFAVAGARADEGMWTFDNPPLQHLQQKYNFTPSQQWLEHVRLSSVRMNDGGSASFISPHGLILTNHHVALGQLQKNSNAQRNYVRDGFYAATQAEEMKSPDAEVNVLVALENVTDRVAAAVKGAKTPEAEFAARRAVMAQIEKESTEKTGLRSDIVTLYQGGEYWLYRYKKYTDVRLVFAPEQEIAFWGGDPDNFTYPRYDLDMAIFRVYEDGKPVDSANYLKWNPKGIAENDLVFVSGHPGTTERLDTVAQLETLRDSAEPLAIKNLKSRMETLRKYAAGGEEQARQTTSLLFSAANSLKAREGRLKGLLDPNVMAKKQSDEKEFRAKVTANPEWRTAYAGAWDAIADAQKKSVSRAKEQTFRTLDSQLATLAMRIVQYVAEIRKPDGERLSSYHDAQLESLRQSMFSPAPIYPALETARIAGALQTALNELGANDAFVKAALAGRTPQAAAAALLSGTKLTDPAFRKQLVDGGEAAVNASTDPMIVAARQLDPIRRELTKWLEDNVSSVTQRAGEQLGKARFSAYGKTTYPDANFTLRLSYGQVKGYAMNGTIAPYKTTFYGLYDRAQSFDFKAPFALPPRYVEGRTKLDLSTPFDFVTTNDVVGGNSGSPVIDRNGELVGLVFDGNIESLVGDYVYDVDTNRTVAVNTAAMTEALRKLYGAQKLVDELLGK
jgi:hypothetical protein